LTLACVVACKSTNGSMSAVKDDDGSSSDPSGTDGLQADSNLPDPSSDAGEATSATYSYTCQYKGPTSAVANFTAPSVSSFSVQVSKTALTIAANGQVWTGTVFHGSLTSGGFVVANPGALGLVDNGVANVNPTNQMYNGSQTSTLDAEFPSPSPQFAGQTVTVAYKCSLTGSQGGSTTAACTTAPTAAAFNCSSSAALADPPALVMQVSGASLALSWDGGGAAAAAFVPGYHAAVSKYAGACKFSFTTAPSANASTLLMTPKVAAGQSGTIYVQYTGGDGGGVAAYSCQAQ
jgi:hypothetical protein